MSKTLDVLYRIRKLPLEARLIAAGDLSEELRDWKLNSAQLLDADPSSLPQLYRRQNVALRLSYSYSLILLHRPFLLDKYRDQAHGSNPKTQTKLEEHVKKCLDAALEVVSTINVISKADGSFKASWVSVPCSCMRLVYIDLRLTIVKFTHYCGYTAIVAVFLYVIKHCIPSNSWQIPGRPIASLPDDGLGTTLWIKHFNAASECQRQIFTSSTETKDSFASSCSLVLDELRAEVVYRMHQSHENINDAVTSTKQMMPVSQPSFDEITNAYQNVNMQTSIVDAGLDGEAWEQICGVSFISFLLKTCLLFSMLHAQAVK
jgi:hypothetical protein